MKKNIINIIKRNNFLKKIYPDGLYDIKIGRMNFYFENKIEFSIYTNQKPVFSPDKWGEWGIDYTTVVLHISGHFLKNVQVLNWQNNILDNCNIEISEKDEIYNIHFIGNNWDILLELEDLIFQSSSTYIDEKLI